MPWFVSEDCFPEGLRAMPVFFNFLRCKAIVASQPLRFPRRYTRPCQHTSVQSPSVLSFVIVNSRSKLETHSRHRRSRRAGRENRCHQSLDSGAFARSASVNANAAKAGVETVGYIRSCVSVRYRPDCPAPSDASVGLVWSISSIHNTTTIH